MFYHLSGPCGTEEDNFFNQMHQTKSCGDDDDMKYDLCCQCDDISSVKLKSKVNLVFRREPNEEVVGWKQVQGQQVSSLVTTMCYQMRKGTAKKKLSNGTTMFWQLNIGFTS